MIEITPDGKMMLIISGVGATLGIGQLLIGKDPITIRLAIGRAIVAGGLGLCAGAVLMVFPDLPVPALVGLACVLVSLGTSALEKLFERLMNRGAK